MPGEGVPPALHAGNTGGATPYIRALHVVPPLAKSGVARALHERHMTRRRGPRPTHRAALLLAGQARNNERPEERELLQKTLGAIRHILGALGEIPSKRLTDECLLMCRFSDAGSDDLTTRNRPIRVRPILKSRATEATGGFRATLRHDEMKHIYFISLPTLLSVCLTYQWPHCASNPSIRTCVRSYGIRERQFRLSKYNTNHSVGVDQLYGQRTRTRL
jgi:hypothetical protein